MRIAGCYLKRGGHPTRLGSIPPTVGPRPCNEIKEPLARKILKSLGAECDVLCQGALVCPPVSFDKYSDQCSTTPSPKT